MKMKSNGCWLKPLKHWAPFDNEYKPNDKADLWSTRRIKWREYIREFDEYPGEVAARAKVEKGAADADEFLEFEFENNYYSHVKREITLDAKMHMYALDPKEYRKVAKQSHGGDYSEEDLDELDDEGLPIESPEASEEADEEDLDEIESNSEEDIVVVEDDEEDGGDAGSMVEVSDSSDEDEEDEGDEEEYVPEADSDSSEG